MFVGNLELQPSYSQTLENFSVCGIHNTSCTIIKKFELSQTLMFYGHVSSNIMSGIIYCH